MTTQRVLWTACPHGRTTDGKLRVSVAVSPQLTTSGDVPGTLAQFPDWEDWPSTNVSFKVKIGPQSYDAAIVDATPSSSLWEALFPPTTPVNPYQYSSPTSSPLYSYPAAFVRHFFQKTYAALVGTEPVGGWPSFQLLTSDLGFGALPLSSRALYDEIEAVKSLFPAGGGPIPPGKGPDPATDLTQNYLFLQPLTTPPSGATYDTTPPPPVPQFDFHEAVSLLGHHPPLLRLFGLVYELELSPPSGLSGAVAVSVVPAWTPKLTMPGAPATTNVMPMTMTNAAEWIPAHRLSDPEIAAGYLRLSDPDYEVVELDLDGATLKAFNFAQGIEYAGTEMRSASTPNSYAVPSLRSAGLSVAKTGNALALLPALGGQRRLQLGHRGGPAHAGDPLLRGHRPGLPHRRLVEDEGALVPALRRARGQRTRARAATPSDRRPRSCPCPQATRAGSSPPRPRAPPRGEPLTRPCTSPST